MNMNKNPKKTPLYGLMLDHIKETKKFNDSELFPQNNQIGVKLKSIKIYFIQNQRFLGLESSFANYITGEQKQSGYHGGEIVSKDIEIKQLVVKDIEYIKNFEITFDEKFDNIIYLKITTNKDNFIEFGENKGKKVTFLGFEGDNMIQSFYGDYDKEGINNIGFQFITRKQFTFYNIFPILKLRYKLNHDEEFKKKYESNYQNLLKDNVPMIYLYRSCVLPDSIFAKIIKYC